MKIEIDRNWPTRLVKTFTIVVVLLSIPPSMEAGNFGITVVAIWIGLIVWMIADRFKKEN